ncbi:receptor-like protein kinase ANXUR2 [Bidens hawaiensis]|uniref:receptor-like protein kinase ANXUR2 n=1 Tax=Bidens hawaiensis TaxID=980011 RepID=UPI0040499292
METHQRLIHCDVKGGNILLDDHWNAKVADFGFSILGPTNEQQSTIITLAAGTQGYIDPLYRMTNTLTKESDVYSFGVVLVEVFCGALCYAYSNGFVRYNLVPTWKECYEQKKLNDIIFNHPTIQPLEQSALKIFSDIAYRCLKESREDRPKMADVVTKLETAFEIQEFESSCYQDIVKSAEPPLKYKSENELTMLLSKGVLLNGRKTWFSLNKRGERCEIISIDDCLGSESKWPISKHNSRCY